MFDYDKFNNNASLDLVINGVRKKIPRFYSIYIYIHLRGQPSRNDDRRRKKEKRKRNWKELVDKSDRVGRRMNDVAGARLKGDALIDKWRQGNGNLR